MVCIYNPTAEQLNALDNYQRVLGSEEAAYYVLSQNNGFPLDKTPSGEDSDVYQELLQHYGNEDEAIRMKSIMYTSRFLESNGDWTMGTQNDPTMFDSKGEPLANLVTGTVSRDLQDILNHQFLLDSNATVVETDLANVKSTDNLSDYAVDQLLKMSYDRYVTEKNDQYIKENPNSTEDERLQNKVELSRQWYSRKVERIMTEQVRALAKAFGFIYIQRPNGSIELQTRDRDTVTGVKALRLKFLNSIVQDPLEDELRTQVLGLPRNGETTTLKVEGAPEYMHDAILRHIQNDRMLAANTLIKVSLDGGTSTTINKALAYNYITMFIDSPLIDAGLQAVDDGKGRSKLYLVNKLVEEITSPTIAGVKNSSILERVYKEGVSQQVFDDFWSQFDDLLSEVINKGVKSEQAKQKILSVVAAAFQINDTYNIFTRPALYSAVPHYDYFADWYSSKYKPWGEQNKKEISTIEQFLNTLATFYQNKIKRQERDPYVTKESSVRTQQALHTLEQTDMSNPVEVEKAISDVLDVAYQEISDADRIIDSLNLNTIGVVKQLANLGSEYMNVIGFYNYIVNVQLKDIFPDKNKIYPNLDLLYKAVQILLSNLQTKYKNRLRSATQDYVSYYIDRYVDKNVVTEEQIRNMKANIHAELINDAIFGDLKNYELWLTMNSVSVSHLVRQVADSIMRLNFNRDQMTLDVAQQVQIALNKAKRAVAKRPLTWGGYTFAPRNFQMLFQERLDDGTPSGMFVRKYHYGNFFKRRAEYIKELVQDINKDIQNKTGNTHFRIETDRYGNPIFQEGPEWEAYRKNYELKLNDFECTYGNKRFLQEYYDLRIQLLSEDTMAAQDDIQKRIDIILKGVTRDDVTYLNELSVPERRQLDDLYREQDNLGNTYTLGGEEKTGTGLRMAQEIKAFRKAIKNRILYETDQQKFDDALNTITDPTERQAFIDASTERDINPEWWDIYKVLQKEYREQFPDYLQDCFDDIDELTDERNDIINTVKTGRYAQPELRRLSDSAWDRLKELDELIEAAYEPIIDYLKNLPQGSQKIPSAFKQIAEIRDVMDYVNPSKTAFDAFIQEAEDKDAQESLTFGYTVHTHEIEARRKYSRMVRIGPNVKEVPLSAFGYMSPSVFPDHIKRRFNIPDNFEYVKDLPKRFYNKIVDPKSKKYVATPLVNTEFDESEGTYLQPKELNPNYQRLADPEQTPKEVFELYRLCLDVKEAADSLVPSVSSQSRAKLPQMRGSDLALISRVFSRGMLKTVSDVFTNNFVSNETDDDIIDDFTTLPDGTRANNVPLKFIHNLPDMSQLTSDVVGSLVAYYYMAANNYFKAEVAPLYQALLQQVAQDQYIVTETGNQQNPYIKHLILGNTTNLHAKLKNVIDTLLYDQKQLWGERGSQSLKGSQRTGFKTAKFFAKLGTIAALSRNILSQTTGFIDAERKLHAFAFSGEAFNMKNIAFAISLFDSYLVSGRLFLATGEIIPHNLIAAIHQKNNLGTGIEYKYQGGYKNQVRRVAGMERSGMGGFRISDYAITSVIALAIYDNYRLLDNEFLPEISFKNKLKRQGLSNSEINKRYNKALTLLNAYDYDSGFLGIFKRQGEKFKLKPQYQQMLGKQGVAKLEQNVAKAIRTWAPKCNGAVSDEDKAVIQQNILAGFTVALRSYLLNESQTRFAKGRDFQDPNMSERKLRILKKKRNALIKAYKSTKTDSKKKTELDKLMDQKSKIEADLLALVTSGDENSINWSSIKTLFGLSVFEAGVGAYIGSAFGLYGAAIGGVIGFTHGVISARSNLKMNGGADIFKSKIEKLQDKLQEINAKIYSIKTSDAKDTLLIEIMQLNESIAEIEEKINENQGYYDYARNIVTNGSNRLAGRALMNAIRNLYYYINLHLPRAFQSLKATHPIKITDLQIRGLKRLVADFVNLSILWLSTTYMLSWYRYDDGRAFLGGAFNEQTTAVMHKTDKIMENAIRPIMESEPWKNTWQSIHDSSTEGIISDIASIPLFAGMDKAIEQKSDAMLGYNKKVSRKDKSVKRIKQDPVLRQISWLKCFGAVQSLKAFTEQITPYDPQTINDLTNAVSANMNVISKELEASQQMMVEYKQNTLDDPMQGGPYQSYFNRYEYGAAHSWQRPFGFPATFEQTTEIGDINRLNFLLGTGLNKYAFDKKKPEEKKKNKSKSKKRRGGYGR